MKLYLYKIRYGVYSRKTGLCQASGIVAKEASSIAVLMATVYRDIFFPGLNFRFNPRAHELRLKFDREKEAGL